MTPRFIDWIWHIRGSLALDPALSREEAFERLNPIFREPGTRYERTNGRLTFQKKDQAAQDKMSVFDSGVLQVEESADGPVLRYHLISRALLFCFLAPLLFIGFAQLTVLTGKFQKPATAASKAEEAKKDAKKQPPMQLNPIDKFLGAPAPEKPKKDGKDAAEGRKKEPSPTPAYVFAVLFALLFIIGRVLEARQVKALFRRSLPSA